MIPRIAADVILVLAALPLIYNLLALWSSRQFFGRRSSRRGEPGSPSVIPTGVRRPDLANGAGPHAPLESAFLPPVSILKPVRGLDPEAYENFASFCRQDYPDYEILFCVATGDNRVGQVLERLLNDFQARRIRVISQDASGAPNDKVAKLIRLTAEASHEIVVISDSDVRVLPDYLRNVVAPLADPRVGAVTCLYAAIEEKSLADRLQTVGMISDFYPGLLVARALDGVKFALGQTIAARRSLLDEFGGYTALQDRPADDLLVGRLMAKQGYRVELLPYTIFVVADYRSLGDLWAKRLRWLTVMRHMRPWGHLGLVFTEALPWSLLAVAARPTAWTALAFLGAYAVLRIAVAWEIGVRGLEQHAVMQKLPLIPLWDILAFFLWLASFFQRRLRWRDGEFRIRRGKLVAPSALAARPPQP